MTRRPTSPVLRGLQLLVGCTLLGVGVTLALVPALGSDGYSTLVNGLHIGLGIPFLWSSVVVGLTFVGIGWLRGVTPGIGTITQVVVVSVVVDLGLRLFEQPDSVWARGVFLALALPVLAVGIALYLGVGLGAGPVEAAALGFDPPVPFAVSYNTAQALGALIGWWQGAAVGVGTLAVIVLLGPAVTLAARLLRQDLRQPGGRDRSGRPGETSETPSTPETEQGPATLSE